MLDTNKESCRLSLTFQYSDVSRCSISHQTRINGLMTNPPPPPPHNPHDSDIPEVTATPIPPQNDSTDNSILGILALGAGIRSINDLLDLFMAGSEARKPCCCGCGCFIAGFLMLVILGCLIYMVRSV